MENKDFEPIIDWSGYEFSRVDKDEPVDIVNLARQQYKEGFKTGWTGMMDALKDVVWYNGISDFLNAWVARGDEEYENGDKYGMKYIHCKCNPIGDGYPYAQLELIWMLCVMLFGNYGTSPRSGWIENWPKCKEFLLYLIDEEDIDD